LHPCGLATEREPGAVVRGHEVRERTRDDSQAVGGKVELGDDATLKKAHRVARHRVAEPGMELLGDGRAADESVPLEHRDAQSRAGKVRGAYEAVVPAADDRDVVAAAWARRSGVH